MNKSKLYSEIHNGIMYLLSKNITKEKLQSTIERMVDEYHESEVKKLNLADVSTRLNVGTKIFKKHRCCVGTIRHKSDFGFNHWIIEWDNGNWSREYGLDLNVW